MTITYVPHESRAAWPTFVDAGLPKIPTSRKEVYDVFGYPGMTSNGNPTGVPDPAWVKRNIIELHGKTALPGVPERFYFQVHRLAEPRMREAFRRAQIVCPEYVIERAGCYVYRHIRHDTPKLAAAEERDLRDLSLHSAGIAVDIDADKNQAVNFPRRDAPEPWSPEWMKIWPHGLPRAFVEAFTSVGFVWGGAWKSYCDPQHLQAATCG